MYATRLGHAPIYLTHDEVNFSLQSIAIAQTGRDLNGRLVAGLLFRSRSSRPAAIR